MELYEHLVAPEFAYVGFNALWDFRGRAYVPGGEREENLGVAPPYPIHSFYKAGKGNNSQPF